MKTLLTITLAALLLPGASFGAASKEMQELQRDVAQLQEQIRTLQSSIDKQNGTIVELLRQLQDANAKTTAALNQLSSQGISDLGRQIQTRTQPIATLPSEIKNVNNDTTEIKAQVGELTVAMNKILQQLNDVNNSIKVLQTPVAPPPAAGGATGVSGAQAPPPPPASTLWSNARRDYSGGKMELALSGFQDFLKFYPSDPMASQAQFFIGQIHYGAVQYDVAAQDFDAVVERYPESEITSQAQFMKAKSLVQGGNKAGGIKEYKAVVAKYPGSDAAKLATEQLKALGVAPVAAKAPVRKKR